MKTVVGILVLVLALAMTTSMASTSDASSAETLYLQALEALDAKDYQLAATTISEALATTRQEEPLAKAMALKLIAEYEVRTRRLEQARQHLKAALEAAASVYDERHPEMVQMRRLLSEIEPAPLAVGTVQSD